MLKYLALLATSAAGANASPMQRYPSYRAEGPGHDGHVALAGLGVQAPGPLGTPWKGSNVGASMART
jgi:hypothetical protein